MPDRRIAPDRRIDRRSDRGLVTLEPALPQRLGLSPREKAAVIVRYLLIDGTVLPLASLPEHMQAALTEQMGQMRLINRATL
ncbi:MAG: hypothetical protein B7Y02_02155, partial [Rhodobacterales bacterium 17-64-5]